MRVRSRRTYCRRRRTHPCPARAVRGIAVLASRTPPRGYEFRACRTRARFSALNKYEGDDLAVVARAALNKFFGSRRLRASPQGYSPWTSLALRLRHPTHVVSLSAWSQGRKRASRGRTGGGVGVAQARSRASSPGETPAGDDCQIVSSCCVGDDCQKNTC